MVKGISRTLAAVLLAVMTMACVPALAFAGGSSIDDPIAVEVGGSASIELSEGGQREVWFTFTVGQEGDYVAYASTEDDYLDTMAELFDSNQNSIAKSDDGGEDSNFRFCFHCAEGSIFYLKATQNCYEAGRGFTLHIAPADAVSAGLTVCGIPSGEAVWFGAYDGVPLSWVQDGGALYSRYVLFDARYHSSTAQSSCTGYADTDLYKRTLPSFKENSFSALEASAVGGMRLPGDVGVGFSRSGEPKNYWIERGLGTWGDSWAGFLVDAAGYEVDDFLDNSHGVRPAFTPNLTSVIFSSAAVGGKTSGAVGASCLAAVSAGSGGTKLTLHDAGRDGFAVADADADSLSATAGYSDWTVPIAYSGAAAGGSEYVSAVLCNGDGAALYYGHLAAGSESGSVDLAIPEGLGEGSYKLKVFSEQCNGDLRTDYASTPVDIALTVGQAPEPPGPALHTVTFLDGLGATLKTQQVEDGQAATPPAEPAREGYSFIGWDTDFGSVTSDLTVIAMWRGNPEPPAPAKESIEGAKVVLSKAAFTYNGKVQKPTVKTIGGKALKEGTDYIAKWSNVSSKNSGSYTVTVSGIGGYEGTARASYTIAKAANTLTAKGKTAKLSAKKLKKKAQSIKRKAAISVGKACGTVTYAKAGVNKSAKKFSVNAKTGKITVKKGVKKGTYKMKVKVKAAGNANYKAKTKTVTVKIAVA